MSTALALHKPTNTIVEVITRGATLCAIKLNGKIEITSTSNLAKPRVPRTLSSTQRPAAPPSHTPTDAPVQSGTPTPPASGPATDSMIRLSCMCGSRTQVFAAYYLSNHAIEKAALDTVKASCPTCQNHSSKGVSQ